MANKLLNRLFLVDFKKAFDLVDHDTLLDKLRIYGCSHSPLALFRSCLSVYFQETQFRGTLSEALLVSVGVPKDNVYLSFLYYSHQ